MFFTILVGFTALLVAGTGAYFSVLGIATLFSGSYYQVMVMAGALELGKLVATSYLHRYWKSTNWLLKPYLILAVLILMGITSMGIFGYLSAAYQVNSADFARIDSQITMFEQQKESLDKEIVQNNARINTLNESRSSQEKRLSTSTTKTSQLIYKDIEKSGDEIQKLNERTASLQQSKTEKDNEIIALRAEIAKAKDIGTFKFVADAAQLPLDTVVTIFICILICVFDPLAVALILAFNVITNKSSSNLPQIRKDEHNFSTNRVSAPTGAAAVNQTIAELTIDDLLGDEEIVDGDTKEPVDGIQEYEKYQKDKRKIKLTQNSYR